MARAGGARRSPKPTPLSSWSTRSGRPLTAAAPRHRPKRLRTATPEVLGRGEQSRGHAGRHGSRGIPRARSRRAPRALRGARARACGNSWRRRSTVPCRRERLLRSANEREVRVAIIETAERRQVDADQRLVGEERLITSDQPGTTRDNRVPFERGGRRYTLIDPGAGRGRTGSTAGVFLDRQSAAGDQEPPTSRCSSRRRGRRRHRQDAHVAGLCAWSAAVP